jgi:glucose-1-phosphate thymidylyltransferase
MNTPLTKAVILARGLGTRMREPDQSADLDAQQANVADSGVKALIPVGRPFLDYCLSNLADAGYRDVCLVVAPDHEAIRQYYEEEARPQRIAVHFAVQEEPNGTADAVAAAEAFAGTDPFVVINSDNYYPSEALAALREIEGCGTALFERETLIAQSNIPAERVGRFGVGVIDKDGRLTRITEKPDDALLESLGDEVWVSMNCWRFGPSIFEACRRIPLSPRGELEIPAAVQYAMEHLAEPFFVAKIRAGVLDMTGRRDIAAVTERLANVEVRL